jgi:stage II sporulation protein D
MKRLFLYFFMVLIFATLLLVKYFGPWDTADKKGPIIHVYSSSENRTEKMLLEDYLVGVLAAEMPAGFEKEALKAQAIAARTYALKKMKAFQSSGNKVHPQAEICVNPSHCQGWISSKEMRKKWGMIKSWEYERKLKSAVRETAGAVLKYGQDLIDPVYHSTCGGRTENAEEVWANPIPYLKSVSCTWDRESPKYQGSLNFSLSELNKKLGLDLKEDSFSNGSLQKLSETKTGRVKIIKAGNKVFSATEFRQLLGLNSTNFTWQVNNQVTNKEIIFRTIGYGHGVGMCQYGANGLAKKGCSAEKILKYYYQGVNIEKIY